jgi:tRNA(Arg) A34 adenosine deaminase TadA
MDQSHEDYLRKTLELAEAAVLRGNHPFGALVVLDGSVELSAENSVVTEGDCTRHAELVLVSLASRTLSGDQIARATLYSSTEPCPMCAGAIQQCGLTRVVFACSARGLRGLLGKNEVLPCREVFQRVGHPVEVLGPLLEEEGLALHEKYRWWAAV